MSEARITIPPEVLFCEVNEEAVLLDQREGVYYGLDPIAARMWTLLSSGLTLPETAARLEREFEADADRLHADLRKFVEKLAANGLIVRDCA